MAQNPSSAGGNMPLVLLYWAIVGVPLGWGVYKTVQKATPLFTGKTPAVAAPANSPAPAASPTAKPATPAPLAATPATILATPAPSATVGPIETATPTP